LAGEAGIDVRFNRLIDLLQKSKASTTQEVKSAIDEARLLSKSLRELLAILLTENQDKNLQAKKEWYQNLLKQLEKNIRDQKIVRAKTERGTDPNELEKAQERVRRDTEAIERAMEGKTGTGHEAKGIGKDEGKAKGAGQGEGKDDTKD